MITDFITLPVSDGTTMQAFIAHPATNNSLPGILLFQEAFGVNHHIQDVAQRLAEEGYMVIAPELYHRTADPGFATGYDDFSVIAPHFQALSVEQLTIDIQAAYHWLQNQQNVNTQKIASIGFCLGGRVALLANIILPLAAGISFYGGGMQTLVQRIQEVHGPQLFFYGGKDTHISAAHRQEVEQAFINTDKPYANVIFSYAEHGFHCNERSSYHPKAAKEAWALSLAFLQNNL
ncbi:MAG: dienelactone hydrolase family protein [Bacteroidota bacterium]|jgi:carboxymethylenebutenolidase|nr:dienelactone hydrolase family protein [Bacteroidota bacterium]